MKGQGRIKRVMCKSGLWGEQSKLRRVYESFDEFKAYAETYGLHTRPWSEVQETRLEKVGIWFNAKVGLGRRPSIEIM